MELKVEIDALLQVRNALKMSQQALQSLKKDYMQSGISQADFWIGNGKNAYVDFLEKLKISVDNCGIRFSNSEVVLTESLNTYITNENSLIKDSAQLPANDIF